MFELIEWFIILFENISRQYIRSQASGCWWCHCQPRSAPLLCFSLLSCSKWCPFGLAPSCLLVLISWNCRMHPSFWALFLATHFHLFVFSVLLYHLNAFSLPTSLSMPLFFAWAFLTQLLYYITFFSFYFGSSLFWLTESLDYCFRLMTIILTQMKFLLFLFTYILFMVILKNLWKIISFQILYHLLKF